MLYIVSGDNKLDEEETEKFSSFSPQQLLICIKYLREKKPRALSFTISIPLVV